MPANTNNLIADIEMQIAIWADENLFGHDLDDDAYEEASERLADDLHEAVYLTLVERPIR